ncbi:unnamed protein product [Protopolystoma xenopodis]|uniref:Uncharacterized protein n=1 Tax=Protopolystoma xenopodis TaxID=117903 RepID=A0A448WKR2_9PLAT|nr:unnamed protein product [Protopolystoma xenopodis]
MPRAHLYCFRKPDACPSSSMSKREPAPKSTAPTASQSREKEDKKKTRLRDTRSLDSRGSSAALVRTGPDIKNGCKSVLEKTTQLNEQIKERINKLMTMRKSEKNRILQINMEAEHGEWASLMAKCQLAAYAASLMVYATDAVDTSETVINKIKSDFKKAVRENKELKASISFVIEKIHDTEGRLSASKEESLYWKFLYDLNKIEYSLNLTIDEHAVWHEVKIFDVQWNSDIAGPLMRAVEPIYVAIDANFEEEALELIDKLPQVDEENLPTLATYLEIIAKRAYEEGLFTMAEAQMKRVLEIRTKSYGAGKPIIAATLNVLALIYNGMNNLQKATETAYQALDILEKDSVTSKDKTILIRQYTRTGHFLVNWGYYQEGIKLMQMALVEMEANLPKEEQGWSILICKMARACNDAKFHDDAMVIACELIDYYQEKRFGPISEKNLTIYEIAYAQQMASTKDTTNQEATRLPDPVYLPPQVAMAMKEVAIAYACKFQFRAANTIREYIEKCATSCQEEPDTLTTTTPKAFRDRERRRSLIKGSAQQLMSTKSEDIVEEKRKLHSMLSNVFKSKK